MPLRIDVNCDMGESFGSYRMGNDEEAVKYITSSNVACGFHASDPNVMAATVNLCKRHGVKVGAHPGYPDMAGFGRRFMDVADDELIHYVVYQVGALQGFLSLAGMPLQHVKLHGALYNYMVRNEDIFLKMAVSLRVAFGDVILLTLSCAKTTGLKERCRGEGVRLALEAFPDRHYTDEGELLARTDRNAVLKDPALIVARALEMAAGRGVLSVNGRRVPMDIDTICIHGDNLESVQAARTIRIRSDEEGIEIAPLGAFIR
jgi:5-oxoprolinase (ATP-hydrolysing) subunit A